MYMYIVNLVCLFVSNFNFIFIELFDFLIENSLNLYWFLKAICSLNFFTVRLQFIVISSIFFRKTKQATCAKLFSLNQDFRLKYCGEEVFLIQASLSINICCTKFLIPSEILNTAAK